MSSFHDELSDAISELHSDLATGAPAHCTFTFAGDTTAYACIPSTETRETIIVDGNPIDVKLALLVQTDQFNNVPLTSGRRLTWNGKRFKVEKVEDVAGAAVWLYCIDANR